MDDDPRYGNSRAIHVKLEVFEGPLDLLLYLIRKNEYDIFDIPIVQITAQYLAYMEMMKELNLDVAGEFLVMASTLMRIKSRMLLPEPGPEEEEEFPDPREELVRQLLEYQRYKEAARELAERDILGEDIFARKFLYDEFRLEDGAGEIMEMSVFDLVEAFARLLRERRDATVHAIVPEKISLIERINQLVEILKKRRSLDFLEMVRPGGDKLDIIIDLLALLELMKMGFARVFQAKTFGTIRVFSRVLEEDGGDDRPGEG